MSKINKADNLYLRDIDAKLGAENQKHKPSNLYLREILKRIGQGGGVGNLDFIELVITYSDGTTENVNFGIITDGE